MGKHEKTEQSEGENRDKIQSSATNTSDFNGNYSSVDKVENENKSITKQHENIPSDSKTLFSETDNKISRPTSEVEASLPEKEQNICNKGQNQDNMQLSEHTIDFSNNSSTINEIENEKKSYVEHVNDRTSSDEIEDKKIFPTSEVEKACFAKESNVVDNRTDNAKPDNKTTITENNNSWGGRNYQPRTFAKKAIIFRSELELIKQYINDAPEIETGGELLGYCTRRGIPVIMFVTGPGPQATHRGAHFSQDMTYKKEIIETLGETCYMQYLGDWHSHHHLGLTEPSRGDIETTINMMNGYKYYFTLLGIGTISSNRVRFDCYYFEQGNRNYYGVEWDVLETVSPVRGNTKAYLGNAFIKPGTGIVSTKESYLYEHTQKKTSYPYWLEENGNDINKFIYWLKKEHDIIENAELCQMEDKKFAIKITLILPKSSLYALVHITFPEGFPKENPIVYLTYSNTVYTMKNVIWERTKNMYKDFCNLWKNILKIIKDNKL